MEPLSCVLHDVGKVGMVPGEKALVFGGSPIGLLIAQSVLLDGVSAVTVVDRNEQRLGTARTDSRLQGVSKSMRTSW